MNRFIPVIALAAVLFCPVGFSQSPSPSATPSAAPWPSASPDGGGPHCQLHSRNVQLYSFYGTKETVAHNLAHLPVELSERRVFLQITQGAKTNIRLFERQKDGSYAVTEWTEAKAPGLFAEIDNKIIQNQGKNCIGEAIKTLLHKYGRGKTVASVSANVSPQEAFTASVQGASEGPDDFIKGTVIIFC